MSGDEGDKETQLTPIAVQEMVSKVIEWAISSFSGRIMNDKTIEAWTANLAADANVSKAGGDYTCLAPTQWWYGYRIAGNIRGCQFS